jgi:hypothetical protein
MIIRLLLGIEDYYKPGSIENLGHRPHNQQLVMRLILEYTTSVVQQGHSHHRNRHTSFGLERESHNVQHFVQRNGDKSHYYGLLDQLNLLQS